MSDYSPPAEFYDLGTQVQTRTRELLADTLAGVNTDHGPVLDLGAGTGRPLETIASTLPDARILAVEPTIEMRTVLTSRVASNPDLRSRVTILPETAQDVHLPETLSAAVLLGMIGHLDRDERAALWRRLNDRLPAGAPVLVETIPLSTPAAMADMHFAHESLGDHTYDGWVSGEPAGDDLMRWRTTWTVSRGTDVLRTVEHINLWHTVGFDDLAKETGWKLRELSAQVAVLYR